MTRLSDSGESVMQGGLHGAWLSDSPESVIHEGICGAWLSVSPESVNRAIGQPGNRAIGQPGNRAIGHRRMHNSHKEASKRWQGRMI